MRRVMRVEAREGQRFRRWRGPVLAGLLLSVVWVGGGWAPGGVNAQFVPRQVIAGAYWSLEPGFESSLMLSNTSSEPIRVYPDIYDAGGQGVALARLALREHERRQLDLRRWLAEQGLSFSSGSLRLRHTGGVFALAAQVTVTQAAKSWSFDVPLEAAEVFYGSSRLEGLWWRPEGRGEARLILTNTADWRLTVRPTVWQQGQSLAAAPLPLGPHQMREIPIRELLAALNLNGSDLSEGGLRLDHDGEPGQVRAFVVVRNERGFSSTVRFMDPARRSSRQLDGAGLFLRPSRVPGLSRFQKFDTLLLVGNTGDSELEAEVTVTYTVGLRTLRARLPSLRLGGQEVRRLELNEALAGAGRLPRRLDTAGLEITYTGAPGALVAHAVSFDRSTNMAFDGLLKDPDGLASNRFSFPWRLTGETRSLVQIKNPRRRVGHVELKLVHEAGEWAWGAREIQPGETVTLDIRELRERLVADARGEVIPRWVERGQAEWRDLDAGGGLIGRVVIYDPQAKLSTSANEFGPPLEPTANGCINFQPGACTDPGFQLRETAAAVTLQMGQPAAAQRVYLKR